MAEKAAVRTSSQAQPINGEATIQRIGERLIMKLPAEASLALPSRGQVAVDAVMNGHSFETVVEPDGMKGHWVTIDDSLQKTLDLNDGDGARFEFTPTKSWPEPDVPADLQNALAQAPDSAEPWRDITPMARWEWVRWINATKNTNTRERRVEASISKLQSGHRRPCCFDLASCTDPELSKSGRLIDAD